MVWEISIMGNAIPEYLSGNREDYEWIVTFRPVFRVIDASGGDQKIPIYPPLKGDV